MSSMNLNNQEVAAKKQREIGKRIALSLKSYRMKANRKDHGFSYVKADDVGISQAELSEYLIKQGYDISEGKIKAFEAGTRLPTLNMAFELADFMKISVDRLARGVKTRLVHAQTTTGLSAEALYNLSDLNYRYTYAKKHDVPYTRTNLLPLISFLLEDMGALEMLSSKVQHLVSMRKNENEAGRLSDIQQELCDGALFGLQREFSNKIEKFVEVQVHGRKES